MSRPTSLFLALPRELRDDIYHYILNEGVYTFEEEGWYYTLEYGPRDPYQVLSPAKLAVWLLVSKQVMAEGFSKLHGQAVCTRLSAPLRHFPGASKFGSIASIRKINLSPDLCNNFNQLGVSCSHRATQCTWDHLTNSEICRSHILTPIELAYTLGRLGEHFRIRGSQLNDLTLTLRLPDAKDVLCPGKPSIEEHFVGLFGLSNFDFRLGCVHIVLQERRDSSIPTDVAKAIAAIYAKIDREVERVAKLIVCGDSEAKTGCTVRTWVVQRTSSMYRGRVKVNLTEYDWHLECRRDGRI